MNKKLLGIASVLIILFFSCLYLAAISSYWEITSDGATYIAAARSLAQGEGYKELGRDAYLFPSVTSFIYGFFLFVLSDNYFVPNAFIKKVG
jgi:hypothetical protein